MWNMYKKILRSREDVENLNNEKGDQIHDWVLLKKESSRSQNCTAEFHVTFQEEHQFSPITPGKLQ